VIPAPVLCLLPAEWSRRNGRPYQLMTRLAEQRPVYVLEGTANRCQLPLVGASRANQVTVLTPYLPASVVPADGPRVVAPLVEAVLDRDGAALPILWISDAHSLPLVAEVKTAATIYDVGAGGLEPGPGDNEALDRADLVIAHDARQVRRLSARHPWVHLVRNGVDAETWDTAAADLAGLVDDLMRPPADEFEEFLVPVRLAGQRSVRSALYRCGRH
jgi:hypothetical protein